MNAGFTSGLDKNGRGRGRWLWEDLKLWKESDRVLQKKRQEKWNPFFFFVSLENKFFGHKYDIVIDFLEWRDRKKIV